jgi:hypothetical protein
VSVGHFGRVRTFCVTSGTSLDAPVPGLKKWYGSEVLTPKTHSAASFIQRQHKRVHLNAPGRLLMGYIGQGDLGNGSTDFA